MTEKVKVTLTPEKVEELKEKYNLSDEILSDIIRNTRVRLPPKPVSEELPAPPEDATTPGEPKFMRQLMRGDIGLGEAVFYGDYLERKDERAQRRKRNDGGSSQVTAKEIRAELVDALRNAGVVGKPGAGKEEMPEWAKKSMKQQGEILKRMTKDDEEKERKTFVKEVTTPLMERLDRQDERQARQDEKLALLSKAPPEGVGPPKSAIQEYIDGRKALKDAGILKDVQKSNIMMVSPDGTPMTGIPVKGEIPAVVVYGPAIVKQVLDSIESTADRIADKYGLGPTKTEAAKKRPLIVIPEKPAPAPTPAETPAALPEKLVKIPEKPSTPRQQTIQETKAVAKVVKVPEKPTPPKKVTKVTEIPEKLPEISVEEGPVELELPEPIVGEVPGGPVGDTLKTDLIAKPPETSEEPAKPLERVCVTCGTPVTKVDMKERGVRYRCPKCKKFRKTKKVEKNGSESKSSDK